MILPISNNLILIMSIINHILRKWHSFVFVWADIAKGASYAGETGWLHVFPLG
jgi:hypothetical protein